MLVWWFVCELTGSHKCNADGSEEKYEAFVVLKKLCSSSGELYLQVFLHKVRGLLQE